MHGTVTSYYLLKGHKALVQYFDHVFEPDPCLLLDIKTHVNIQSYMCQARTGLKHGMDWEMNQKMDRLNLRFLPLQVMGRAFMVVV